jgi:Ring finger domain
MFNPFADFAASASRFAANFNENNNTRGGHFNNSGTNARNQRRETVNSSSSQARRAPPASTRAIRNLPIVKVTADDLLEETNKECLICLEEQKMGSYACKLACGHLYHKQCLTEWLEKHCSCESYGSCIICPTIL